MNNSSKLSEKIRRFDDENHLIITFWRQRKRILDAKQIVGSSTESSIRLFVLNIMHLGGEGGVFYEKILHETRNMISYFPNYG